MSEEREQYGLDEIFDYKNQIMEDLLTNPGIVSLITDDPHLRQHPERLVYTQIYPWERVPDTTEDATVYICCEVDVRKIPNKTYMLPTIYVWVIVHDSLLRLPNGGGVRYDKLSSEIVKTLNGSRKYGLGELDLSGVKKISPIDHYQGRTLTFDTFEFNRQSPTGKEVPSKRRG